MRHGRGSWSNVPGTTVRELTVVDNLLADEDNELPAVLSAIAQNTEFSHFELEICWLSSGYYQPAVWYLRNGDPGYPEEGEDERVLSDVILTPFDENGKRQTDIVLTQEQKQAFFDHYEDQIYKEDLPADEPYDYDPPDYDD